MSYKTIGTGLFRRKVRSVAFNAADRETIVDAFRAFNESEAWLWRGALKYWRGWLDEQLPITKRCPGRNDPRCCGWWHLAEADDAELNRRGAIQEAVLRETGSDPSEGAGRRTIEYARDMGCRGAKWRELDDLEWHIADAEWLYRMAEKQIADSNVNEAALFSLQLGNRLAQIEMKLVAEDDALFGRAKRESSAVGGRATRKRPDTERIAAVRSKLIGNPLLSDRSAIRLVARDLDESIETIRNAWRRRHREAN